MTYEAKKTGHSAAAVKATIEQFGRPLAREGEESAGSRAGRGEEDQTDLVAWPRRERALPLTGMDWSDSWDDAPMTIAAATELVQSVLDRPHTPAEFQFAVQILWMARQLARRDQAKALSRARAAVARSWPVVARLDR